jgi:hypothetical protein
MLTGECKAPIKNTLLYNSWMECMNSGSLKTIKMLNLEGPENVNTYLLGVKYWCSPVNEI